MQNIFFRMKSLRFWKIESLITKQNGNLKNRTGTKISFTCMICETTLSTASSPVNIIFRITASPPNIALLDYTFDGLSLKFTDFIFIHEYFQNHRHAFHQVHSFLRFFVFQFDLQNLFMVI